MNSSTTALALVSTAPRPRQDVASLYAEDEKVRAAEFAANTAHIEAVSAGAPALGSRSGTGSVTGTDTGATTGRRTGAVSSREATRLRARAAELGKALDRLMMSTGTAPEGTVLALIHGAASGKGGVTLAASADRIVGVYTDDKAGLSPQRYYNDARLDDQLALRAGEVGSVYTDGGDDVVAIEADLVESIYTGNDSDVVAITGNVVRSVYTDNDARHTPQGRAGTDAVAINARYVDSVYTGGGADAVAINAHVVESVYAGAGNDAIRISADLVAGIHGDDGDDVIDVTATAGRADGFVGFAPSMPDLSTTEGRMAATALVGGVDGGAGNDTIRVASQGPIEVAGGTGDDSIRLEGGTVGLVWSAGDGNDQVALGAGTEVVVRLDARAGSFSVERGEDSLTLRMGTGGAITFTGVRDAGMIAVTGGMTPMSVLSEGAMLDRSA
ncbi:hypothetical protein [Phaeovulum vinaykumarii]|nr:hypothetical protein [Phaeovulum vinaykumarii]